MILKNPLKFYSKIKRFILVDLWSEDEKYSAFMRLFSKSLKICFFAVKEFIGGQWSLKASALTFVSLVSLVPLLAFILSISKGLGADKVLDQKINEYIFDLPGGEVTFSYIDFRRRFFDQINNLDFTNPAAKKELLSIINSFDGITSEKEEEEKETFFTIEKSGSIIDPDESGLPQDPSSDQKEIKTSIKSFKEELSKIVNSIDFSGKNAKKELKEQVELVILSIPSNISMDAFQYKEQIMHFVGKTSFGYLGAIGVLILMYVIVRTLGTIEQSFNSIWNIKKSRSIFRKLSDYISMLIIVPILFLVSTTITAALTNVKLVTLLNMIGIGKIYLTILGWFLPIAALWIAFIAAYILVPNTKVKFIPGVIGGMAGGTIFYVLQFFYFKSQIGLTRYNVIYGAFAAIPFFLLWVQMSWIVILFGAELTFVIQNIKAIKLKHRSGGLSYAFRELLGLIIMERIASQFLYGKGEKWSDERLSEALNIPVGVIQDIIFEFSEASLIVEIPIKHNIYYIPGRDLDSIYVSEILSTMRNYGEIFEPVQLTPYDQKMAKLINETQNTIQKNLRFSIKDLIQKLNVEEENRLLPLPDNRTFD